MGTCEKCVCFDIDGVTELLSKDKKDGFCEMIECMVNADELPCKNYCEKG